MRSTLVSHIFLFEKSINQSQLCGVVGGGFFTGRYRSMQDEVEPGSRFDPTQIQGKVCLSKEIDSNSSFLILP
jgi:hypothetical protein